MRRSVGPLYRLNDVPGLLQLNAGRAVRSGRRQIDLTDWDGDGRLDLLVSTTSLYWIGNSGISERKDLVRQSRTVGPNQASRAHHSAEDDDGKRELLVGAEDGLLYRAAPVSRLRH